MTSTSKIYVAGHRGMVGSAIVRVLQHQGQTKIVTRKGVDEVSYWNNKPIIKVDLRYFRPTEIETLLGDSTKAKENSAECRKLRRMKWSRKWWHPIWLVRKNMPCANSMAIKSP